MFVCLCVCLLSTTVSPAKTAEPIEIPFGGQTDVDQMNQVLGAGQGCDKTAMRPFVESLRPLITVADNN